MFGVVGIVIGLRAVREECEADVRAYNALHPIPAPLPVPAGTDGPEPPTAPPSIPDRDATQEEIAFLSPLTPGGELADGTIEKIFGHNDMLRIDIRRGSVVLHVDIALVGRSSPEPSTKTANGIGVYFQAVRVPAGTARDVSAAVAKALDAHGSRPIPPTMHDFPPGGGT
jgi:hypothetical protein